MKLVQIHEHWRVPFSNLISSDGYFFIKLGAVCRDPGGCLWAALYPFLFQPPPKIHDSVRSVRRDVSDGCSGAGNAGGGVCIHIPPMGIRLRDAGSARRNSWRCSESLYFCLHCWIIYSGTLPQIQQSLKKKPVLPLTNKSILTSNYGMSSSEWKPSRSVLPRVSTDGFALGAQGKGSYQHSLYASAHQRLKFRISQGAVVNWT